MYNAKSYHLLSLSSSSQIFFIIGSLQCFAKVELFLQPAAFEMSFRVIPMLFPLLDDAFRVECAVNTVISIPANPRKLYSFTISRDSGHHNWSVWMCIRQYQIVWLPIQIFSDLIFPCEVFLNTINDTYLSIVREGSEYQWLLVLPRFCRFENGRYVKGNRFF